MAAGTKGDSHQCEWRERAEALEISHARLAETVESLARELKALKRRTFDRKSEKLPRVQDELRAGRPVDLAR